MFFLREERRMRTTLWLLAILAITGCASSRPSSTDVQSAQPSSPTQQELEAAKTAAGEFPNRNLGLFKSCASDSVLKYRQSRLPASELTDAAIAACDDFKRRLAKDFYGVYNTSMAQVHATSPSINSHQEF